jgi:hypothetical protein
VYEGLLRVNNGSQAMSTSRPLFLRLMPRFSAFQLIKSLRLLEYLNF